MTVRPKAFKHSVELYEGILGAMWLKPHRSNPHRRRSRHAAVRIFRHPNVDQMLRTFSIALILIGLLPTAVSNASAQCTKPNAKADIRANAVMWEPVRIADRDLFFGPGGEAMLPDVSTVTFLEEEEQGHNKKFRIKDANGRVWVAKTGREAKPETVAVRLLWGLGYKTEINYLVPVITIPSKGTFHDVRLEARRENVERLDHWKWQDNPFDGTMELQGLKMMMVFMNNWDVLDLQNKVLAVKTRSGFEHQYVVSDLGSTFGKLGNNNFPIIYRLGRSTGDPSDYIGSRFVKKVEDGEVILAYKGKNRDLFKGFTIPQAKWLADLLNKLSDQQIGDAFRAARYSPKDVKTYVTAVKNKISELNRAVSRPRLAKIQK